MDNYQIADVFSLLSKLMDIHGENGFKAKSYAAAAFAIEKLSTQLLDYPKEKIAALQGIGTSTAQKIIELIETGKLNALENLLANTPAGIVEMLQKVLFCPLVPIEGPNYADLLHREPKYGD